MFVNVIVTKLTSDNACKVWKKRVFVVPLHSISKTNLLLPMVAKSYINLIFRGRSQHTAYSVIDCKNLR